MRVLVTGGLGFIGSHLVDSLVASGVEVHAVDDLSTGSLEFANRDSRVLYSDFGDLSVLRYVSQSSFDVVYHLAARTSTSLSMERPSETTEENVAKTVRLLEACVGNVGRFVLASSAAVYGEGNGFPHFDESVPRVPESFYALQKATCEDLCAMFSRVKGLQTVSARVFNVYGPRQLPTGVHAAVVPAFTSAALRGGDLILHGDGTARRDMIHVADVVRAMRALGELGYATAGEAFNVGTGKATSMNDVARLVADIHEAKTGVRLNVARTDVRRFGDVEHSVANVKAARDFLGFEAQVELRQGFEQVYDWFTSLRSK